MHLFVRRNTRVEASTRQPRIESLGSLRNSSLPVPVLVRVQWKAPMESTNRRIQRFDDVGNSEFPRLTGIDRLTTFEVSRLHAPSIRFGPSITPSPTCLLEVFPSIWPGQSLAKQNISHTRRGRSSSVEIMMKRFSAGRQVLSDLRVVQLNVRPPADGPTFRVRNTDSHPSTALRNEARKHTSDKDAQRTLIS